MKNSSSQKKAGHPGQDYEPYIRAVLARKAENVVVLDVAGLTSYTDMLIICSGLSNRQVSAIAESVKVDLKKDGISPLSVDGEKEGQWVLIDYGHVVIHVFYEDNREYYDIEGLWADAGRLDIDYLDSPTNTK